MTEATPDDGPCRPTPDGGWHCVPWKPCARADGCLLGDDDDWMDTAPADEAIGTQFVAQLNGTCAVEYDRIQPGDMIQRTPGGFAHTACLRAATRPVVWE